MRLCGKGKDGYYLLALFFSAMPEHVSVICKEEQTV